jgi:hypothetical protein
MKRKFPDTIMLGAVQLVVAFVCYMRAACRETAGEATVRMQRPLLLVYTLASTLNLPWIIADS